MIDNGISEHFQLQIGDPFKTYENFAIKSIYKTLNVADFRKTRKELNINLYMITL